MKKFLMFLLCLTTVLMAALLRVTDVHAAEYSGNFDDYKYSQPRDYYINYTSGNWTYEIKFSTDFIIAFCMDESSYAPRINYKFGYLGNINSNYWNYLTNSISCEVHEFNASGTSDSTYSKSLDTQFVVNSMNTNVPIFDTQEEAQQWILEGGQLLPDLESAIYDNDFDFTDFNFHEDNFPTLSAYWTGTTSHSEDIYNPFVVVECGYSFASQPAQIMSRKTIIDDLPVSSHGIVFDSSIDVPTDLVFRTVKYTPYYFDSDVLYSGVSHSFYFIDGKLVGSQITTTTGDVDPDDIPLTVDLYDDTFTFINCRKDKDNLIFYWDGFTRPKNTIYQNKIVVMVRLLYCLEGYPGQVALNTSTDVTFDGSSKQLSISEEKYKKRGDDLILWRVQLIPVYFDDYMKPHHGLTTEFRYNPDGTPIDDLYPDLPGYRNPIDNPGDIVGIGSGNANFEISDFLELFKNFFSLLSGLITLCGNVPALVGRVFSFLPTIYTNMLLVGLGLVIFLRVMSR